MSDATIVYLVLVAVVALFIWNKLPVEVVAVGSALTLAATGVLSLDQALAGFGDTTVLFIAALFVVSEGIDSTGVTTWAGQQLIDRAGASRTRLIILMMLLVAVLTAVISVNGAVAALLPMVVVIALRVGRAPSSLLMPLAFGAHAGSQLALTGTPVHILVSDAAIEAGEAGFNYFEFGLVGVPVVVGAIAIVVLFGTRLLPERVAESIPPDLSDHARTLIDQYSLGEWVARLEVQDGSPLVGGTPSAIDVDGYPHLNMVGVQGQRGVALPANDPIGAGFVITARGKTDVIHRFAEGNLLVHLPTKTGGKLIDRQIGVVEVVIPPRSDLVGEMMFPGMVTESGDFVVLAIQRRGENLDRQPTPLAVGDTMLLQGTWDALDRRVESDRDVLVVDSPSLVRRQAIALGPRAWWAIAILFGMVILLATNAVPAVEAALLAAGAMILTRVVTIYQAYRSVSWTTVVLVAGMIPLSTAVTQSGAADDIAQLLIDVVGNYGPYALLLGLFILTAIFGQLISNMATALIVIPIAVTAAVDMGVSVRPVLMSLTVAAAGAFLTPVATPVNLMVQGPAGYEFGDYWKLGLPMLLLFMAAAVLLVPVFWPF
ncbi:MAG TPA: SLC13 family permease [Acidimicrobiia bacterium]|nr:SLC13 family permease [Acidimicrobiia bacterium]